MLLGQNRRGTKKQGYRTYGEQKDERKSSPDKRASRTHPTRRDKSSVMVALVQLQGLLAYALKYLCTSTRPLR